MPKWIQWMTGFLMLLVIPWSAWTSVKVIEVERDVCALKAVNEAKHGEFHRNDNTLLIEQRALSNKLDKTHDTVIKIATKMDIDVP